MNGPKEVLPPSLVLEAEPHRLRPADDHLRLHRTLSVLEDESHRLRPAVYHLWLDRMEDVVFGPGAGLEGDS